MANIVDLRGDTLAVENNNITPSVRKGYIRTLCTFMQFLYNDKEGEYQHLLLQLEALHDADQKDTNAYKAALWGREELLRRERQRGLGAETSIS